MARSVARKNTRAAKFHDTGTAPKGGSATLIALKEEVENGY